MSGKRYLRPDTNEIVEVLPGLGDMWIAGTRKPNGSIKRLKTRRIPPCEVREVCQEWLDMYVELDKKSKWPVVVEEEQKRDLAAAKAARKKWKVGDLVRIRNGSEYDGYWGRIYCVPSARHPNWLYNVTLLDTSQEHDSVDCKYDQMELVEEKEMAKTTTRATPIDAIEIGDRTRKELGDLDALAASIKQVGLLQPVVIDSDNKLIAGRRRIEACKNLGWKQIPTVVAESVDTLLKMAQAESDENTCRKDFTPEEAVRMGQRIEGAIAELNKKAKQEGRKKGGQEAGRGRPKKDEKVGANLAPSNRDARKTRSETAKAVGMKHTQYEKAKQVVDSGNQQAIDQMNKTGKVDPAFRAVKREEKKKALRKKAAEVAKEPAHPEKPKWNIILGDCFKELPKIKSARLIVADPPYNQGVDYGEDFDDEIDEDEYLRWSRQWINLCVGALAKDGSLWVIISDEWADHLAIMLTEAGLTRRAWIKWYETFGVNNVNNFNRCSRHIFYYVVDPKRFVFNAESRYIRRPSDRQAKYGDGRADPDGKLWDDVWTIPRLVDNAKERIPDFPTQIPLAITRAIVACASEPGDLVVDPFCGSGSTGHAALELHRRFTGIEIGEQFCDLATVRLAGVTPCAVDAL